MRSSRRAAPIRFAAIAAAAALLTGAGTALAVERDAPPPEVAITGSPPAKVKIARAGTATLTWEFAADRPGTFNCKLTGRGLIAPCTSPVTLAGAPGRSDRHQEDRERVAAAEDRIAHRRRLTTRTSSRARLASRLVSTSIA